MYEAHFRPENRRELHVTRDELALAPMLAFNVALALKHRSKMACTKCYQYYTPRYSNIGLCPIHCLGLGLRPRDPDTCIRTFTKICGWERKRGQKQGSCTWLTLRRCWSSCELCCSQWPSSVEASHVQPPEHVTPARHYTQSCISL